MTIKETIRHYIRANFLFGADASLSDESSLLAAGIIDSTGAMELVTFVETEFDIAVDDRDLVPENLDSVTAIAAFVARRLAERGQSAAAALAAAS